LQRIASRDDDFTTLNIVKEAFAIAPVTDLFYKEFLSNMTNWFRPSEESIKLMKKKRGTLSCFLSSAPSFWGLFRNAAGWGWTTTKNSFKAFSGLPKEQGYR